MKISVDIALLYLVVSNPQHLFLIQSSQAFHSLYRYPHTLGYLPGWDKKALMNYWSKWLAKNLSGISLSLFPVCRPLLGAWVGWSLNSQATQPTQAMRPRLPDHRYDHRHRHCHRHHHKFLCYQLIQVSPLWVNIVIFGWNGPAISYQTNAKSLKNMVAWLYMYLNIYFYLFSRCLHPSLPPTSPLIPPSLPAPPFPLFQRLCLRW